MICLLPNCCFLSETSRILEIHGALRRRGAEVRVATQGGTYEHLLREAGIDYDVLGPGFSPKRCEAFVRSVPGLGPPGQSMWSDEELRAYTGAEAAYFRAHGVQVAVTGWTLTALLSTRVVGIPLVTEHAGSFLPPLFERGLLPAPSQPVGMPLESLLPRVVRRRMFNRGAPRLSLYTAGFNRVAAELGVEGVPSFVALLLGDLTLVTDVPEVFGVSAADVGSWTPREPGRYRAGTRLRYAGPIYAHLPIAVPDDVDRFLEAGRPIVYVALTSSRAELVREVVTALRALDVRILVAGTAHELRDLSEEGRVLVGGVLPSHLIMPRVDLAVITGGQGSTQTAIASGLPFVGIPLQPEQDANVALVERRGAARLVPREAAGTPLLARAARTLLEQPSYREAAQHLQSAFARVDGPGAAADAILDLIGAAYRQAGCRST